MTTEELFTKIYPVHDEKLREELIACTRIKHLKKNTLLNRQDEMDSEICFLKSGIVGTYDILTEGKNNYYCICDRPGEVIVGGMGPNNMKSMVDVIMLTNVDLFSIRSDQMNHLQKTYPEIMVFYNKILVYEYFIQWEANRMLRMENAEDRYQWFVQKHPHAIGNINHKAIASFLRMSPVTLSRVKKTCSH